MFESVTKFFSQGMQGQPANKEPEKLSPALSQLFEHPLELAHAEPSIKLPETLGKALGLSHGSKVIRQK